MYSLPVDHFRMFLFLFSQRAPLPYDYVQLRLIDVVESHVLKEMSLSYTSRYVLEIIPPKTDPNPVHRSAETINN